MTNQRKSVYMIAFQLEMSAQIVFAAGKWRKRIHHRFAIINL